jgi:hypothetical protein
LNAIALRCTHPALMPSEYYGPIASGQQGARGRM